MQYAWPLGVQTKVNPTTCSHAADGLGSGQDATAPPYRVLAGRRPGLGAMGGAGGPAGEPVGGRVSIRAARRISAVSASVTATRCSTRFHG